MIPQFHSHQPLRKEQTPAIDSPDSSQPAPMSKNGGWVFEHQTEEHIQLTLPGEFANLVEPKRIVKHRK